MKNNRIAFTADPARLSWRVMHGIPAKVTSEYAGYTGPKFFDFPTSPTLEKHLYPDITEHYNNLLSGCVETVNKKMGKNRLVNFFKKCLTLGCNLKTADKWDTKFLENFPGRTKDGKVQYALLKNKVVNANFVSNYFYGELLLKLNLKKEFCKLAARIDAHGISNLVFERKIPTIKNLTFSDTDFDQKVIDLAYDGVLK